ncbi:MAG TPA: S-methyl-5-thioribose-1-phosphate isomerase [Deltaproteobacteria bacterium]|nr:S-methyl-5-thioribose-1-phosphate isomerase [Deltaproteobacteria bacterium]HOM28540.1 S-methyl-5-thioribose-1-phosphate isomerase [Deltaproteobacteria bacterium]HPP80350.1 S-methyl-5-thioribose-1-phosphate isomerase [Deltaproteobacteria bacterium]
MITPFEFVRGAFRILDQRLLPSRVEWIECTCASHVAQAIRTLAVRGAPAIGIAAAFGLALEAKSGRERLEAAADLLVKARPTAVNLAWAVRRCMERAALTEDGLLAEALEAEAFAIWDEEREANEAMAELGSLLFDPGRRHRVLTHCNAGALATGGIGTALGVVKRLNEKGLLERVYVDETRPLLQGARITAFELVTDAVPCTLVTDSTAGWLMRRRVVDAVIVGADRIALNLDTANKIGSYSLAVLAHAHGVPFYVAAPISTFDRATPSGEGIPIEERAPEEVLEFAGAKVAPGVDVYNPAFDVVPAGLVSAFITEKGIVRRV